MLRVMKLLLVSGGVVVFFIFGLVTVFGQVSRCKPACSKPTPYCVNTGCPDRGNISWHCSESNSISETANNLNAGGNKLPCITAVACTRAGGTWESTDCNMSFHCAFKKTTSGGLAFMLVYV